MLPSKQPLFVEEVETWAPVRRVAEAKKATELLVNRVDEIVQLQEIVKIVAYSDILARQIPVSQAGHAFNISIDAIHQFLVVRVIGVWDAPEHGQFGIPTIAALINGNDVLKELRDETFRGFDSICGRIYNPGDNPELRHAEELAMREEQKHIANEQADRVPAQLRALRKDIFRIKDDALTVSVRDVRNRISHALTQTDRERKGKPTQPMKFGDEDKLICQTIKITEMLRLLVCGAHYDIDRDAREIFRERAEALWCNCRFDIPE